MLFTVLCSAMLCYAIYFTAKVFMVGTKGLVHIQASLLQERLQPATSVPTVAPYYDYRSCAPKLYSN